MDSLNKVIVVKRIITFILSTLVILNISAQNQEFALPSIISDHAVMQRNSLVKLWGWCPSVWNLKIVSSWAPSDTIYVKSDMYCQWETHIQTPNEAGPHSIRFYGWENQLQKEIKDILMGETWLCSGQSNMEFNSNLRVSDAGDITKAIENKQIRFFKVSKATSKFPVERMAGQWEVCSPETYKDFSAVGFHFGQHLNNYLNVPIGLIGSYWGGTAIEPWIDEYTFQREKELFDLSQKQQIAGWSPTANSSIYNAMIHPIKNYTIAGVIWYQGEANNERALDYGPLFEGLIKGWRNDFHDSFPFYFVQIAPWNGYADRNAAYLREQQQYVASKLPDTGMVVISDLVDDITDIHPNQKKQVGIRLANLALRKTYSREEVKPDSPVFQSYEVQGRNVLITTTAIGKLTSRGKTIQNFEVIDKQGNIHPATATILHNGKICVATPKVKEPVGVRYCFTNDAVADIFDSNGLPLAPFRTDKMK